MASAAWCVIAVDLHLQGASGLTWRNALAVEDSLKFERSKKKEVGLSLRLWSPAFGKGEDIPKRFTADGENLSSAFNWSGAPDDTKSSLLVCDDPDAPGEVFLHWVAYSTPADRIEFREGYGPENGFQKAINERQFMTDLEQRGHKVDAIYYFCTTCPKCAEVYGKNYIVAVAKLAGNGATATRAS